MPESIDSVLSRATFYSDGIDYVLIKLPAQAITVAAGIIAEIGEPFAALVVDKDEVTLLICAEAVDAFSRRLDGCTVYPTPYRLITIDVELDPALVGFIAHISRALAEAEISILPYAAYTRDHLFVTAAKIDEAIAVLEGLKSGSST
jgi:hypothetical protein